MHCTSIEPFDLEYLKNHDPPIKYMSFHAYLKKLKSGVDKLVQ
jgi:nuclear protein localization family protein 4